MRGLVLLFLFVVIGVVFFSFTGTSINEEPKKENNEQLEFSTFTSAVCENKEDFVYCKDEIFVNCNGNISKAIDVAECNGIRLDVPEASGFAVFEKGWKDPRE